MTTATILSCLLALAPAQTPTTQRCDLERIGLSFDCPSNWKITRNKKKEVKILVVDPNSGATGVLDIFPDDSNQDKSSWMRNLAVLAEAAKWEMVRQNEEEILGVPLLLTKTNVMERLGTVRVPKTRLNGLLYASTARRMVFNLVARQEDFDAIELQWRNSLQTLRTFDNKPLKPFDPSVRPDPKKPLDPLPSRPQKNDVLSQSGKTDVKPFLAKQAMDMTIVNRALVLRHEPGWDFKRNEDGTYALTNPKVDGVITVSPASVLDSEPADKALGRLAGQSLILFTTVTKRVDIDLAPNRALAEVGGTWRMGSSTTGSLCTLDAVLLKGDFYLLFHYQANDLKMGSKAKEQVMDLLQTMSLDLKP